MEVRAPTAKSRLRERRGMPEVNLSEETVERLDDLRIDDETYDEIVNELINIYEATEMSLAYGGDEHV